MVRRDPDIDGSSAAGVATEIAADSGERAYGTGVDVGDEASVDEAIGRVGDELPPVGALINVAGISDPTSFLASTLAQWERVMRVNATGTYLTCRRVASAMVERGFGRIVNFSTTAAQTGGGNYSKSAYAASKNAVEGLTRSIARELAPHGITANTIAPGSIDTDIMGGPISAERLTNSSVRFRWVGWDDSGGRSRCESLGRSGRRVHHGCHHEHQRRPSDRMKGRDLFEIP